MRVFGAAVIALAAVWLAEGRPSAQQPTEPRLQTAQLTVQATSVADLRRWDAFVTAGARTGALRLRSATTDPALPSRTVERFEQFHGGVRIWGADVVRDSDRGVPVAVFGVLSSDLALSAEPTLSADAATQPLSRTAGDGSLLLTNPELVLLRLDTGNYRLAYTAAVSGNGGVIRAFIDAHTGAELMRYSEMQTQAATVGTGTGVLGDRKKLSVESNGGLFVAFDRHRPPIIQTFDMKGNLARTKLLENGVLPYSISDIASDADNVWTDPAVVDAHVHVSWTYDYYFKRFGRHGLDGRDGPINIVVNAVTQQGASSVSSADVGRYVRNATWCGVCGPGGQGRIFFGNGIPAGASFADSGQNWTYLAGSLDVAAHELTHAVTEATSSLVYRNESGALNEAFSDIIGKSVEFFYHPPGGGVGQADYVIGKDVVRGLRAGSLHGIRSMANPGLYGDPDHYSRRYRGAEDGGGVHTNSGIANHAFYLAIEGGTNRTSGRSVQGVGASNREQIEKVFYRAFTLLMPASSTFFTARLATIQAARDLYGAGGAVERAVTQAWDAVGVVPQATLTFTFSPSPAPARSECGTMAPPCWLFRTTVQESAGIGFTVSSALIGFYDANQNLIGSNSIPFGQYFSDCGSGGSRIPPRGSACSDILFGLGGRSSGYIAFLIEGRDDQGNSLQFLSGLQRLSPASGTIVPSGFVAPEVQRFAIGGER